MNSKPRVLMVDDDVELSEMVAELLAREGWDVQAAATAAAGEAALAQGLPDAVLLDVMLPDANGLDVCRRWRLNEEVLAKFRDNVKEVVSREKANEIIACVSSLESVSNVETHQTPGDREC